jgi:hypothetical protein
MKTTTRSRTTNHMGRFHHVPAQAPTNEMQAPVGVDAAARACVEALEKLARARDAVRQPGGRSPPSPLEITMNAAANLLNFLSCLTVVADCIHDDGHDADDLADAVESADFWWLGQPGGLGLHLPDGRVLRHW